MAATGDEPRGPRTPPRPGPATVRSAAARDGQPEAAATAGRVPRPRRPATGDGNGNGPPGPNRAPLPLAAAVAAAWAAAASATPLVVLVGLSQLVGAAHGSLAAAVRYALAGWLLAHGVPLGTGLGPIGLVPLALAVFAAWRLARAGLHTVRALRGRGSESVRVALSAAAAVATAYGLLGMAAAAAADGPGLAVAPLRAGATLAGFGLVAALPGTMAATGVLPVALRRLPPLVHDGLRTGAVAALLVLAGGAALAGLAIALAGGNASATLASYRAGVAGQAGLTLLCLAYAPNLAVWGAGYLLGPGFAIGAGSVVRTSEVSLGALPALPVFAGLPSGPLPTAGGLLIGAPLVAAMTAGWLLARQRLRSDPSWPPLLGAAAAAGPVAGVLLGLVAWMSGGGLGAGRLAVVGPVPWQVAAAGAGIALVGTVVGAAATRAAAPAAGRRRDPGQG